MSPPDGVLFEKLPKSFCPIKNTIVDALARSRLSAYESSIVWAVIRKTYGWQTNSGRRKTEDYISLSQFEELTGIKQSHISRTLKLLVGRHIITKRGNAFGVNKNVAEWDIVLPKGENTHCGKPVNNPVVDLPKRVSGNLPKGVSGLTKRGKKNLPKGVTTKEKKETYTKESRKERLRPSKKFSFFGSMIRDLEGCITNGDPRPLVDKLVCSGLDLHRTWAMIVQSRRKRNPAGYLVKILSDAEFTVADSAKEQAKKEMRELNY